MFTGQAKIDFEKWYNEARHKEQLIGKTNGKPKNEYGWIELPPLMDFYTCPFSMQSGVYLEWLRSVGIDILINKIDGDYLLNIQRECGIYKTIYNPDHNTALTEAITKAMEIYNERSIK